MVSSRLRRALARMDRDRERRERAAIEVCPNCMGLKEVTRHDGSDAVVTAPCLKCEGTGSIAV